MQYCIYSSLIEHKLIELRRRNTVWHEPVLNKVILVSLFILVGQIIVGDALLQKFGFYFVVIIRDEHMICVNRSLVVICISRDTMLHLKEIVGIAIHIRFRGRSQPHHDCVEIFKDGTVFLENTAMTFIDNNKIKVGRSKHPLSVLCFHIVDGIQHCRVGGKNNSGATVIFVGAEIAQ